MSKTPPPVDYPTLSEKQLRDLKRRYEDAGFPDHAQMCARELEHRGKATRSDYSHLKWNQAHVQETLEPFVTVAKAVTGNKRTAYTEAGGSKIGHKKTDPEWNWIDTYSGIKTHKLTAVFVCYVKTPGADPSFELHVNNDVVARFGPEDLPVALEQWKRIATTSEAT